MSKNINKRLEAFNCLLFLQKSSIKVVRQGSNSHRNCSIKKTTCARVSFLITLQANDENSPAATMFIK